MNGGWPLREGIKACFHWQLIVAAVAIHLLIYASFSVGFATHNVVAIWPVAGLALWMAMRFHWAALPAIWLGDLSYASLHLDFGSHFVLISGGNALAAVLAAEYLRRRRPTAAAFNCADDVMAFFIAALLLSIVAALIGTTIVTERYGLPIEDARWIAWRWFFSDVSGVLLLAPVLVCWTTAGMRPTDWRPLVLPIGLTVAGLVLVTYLANPLTVATIGPYPLILLTMPMIVWLALRCSIAELTLFMSVLLAATLIMILSVSGDVGDQDFLAVQAYAMVIAATALILSATERQRREALRLLEVEQLQLEFKVNRQTAELRQRYDDAMDETDRLQQLAMIDPLTNTNNRRGLEHHAKIALADAANTGTGLALTILDIDHFKQINDRFGHAAGDEIIRLIASLLHEVTRDGIDLVARIGGEEFVVLLPRTMLQDALKLAERLRVDIERANHPAVTGHVVTASFGVTMVDPSEIDLNDALERADSALYRAKTAGRNRVLAGLLASSRRVSAETST